MHDDTVTLGDELMKLLMVIRKRGPGPFDHTADALVPLAKRDVGAIVGDEVGRVELGNAIKPAPVPDDLGQLADERLVALDGVGAIRHCARRHGGATGQHERGSRTQNSQKAPHRELLQESGATPSEVAVDSPGSALSVCRRTPGFTCCRKRERSTRWRQSGASPCWASLMVSYAAHDSPSPKSALESHRDRESTVPRPGRRLVWIQGNRSSVSREPPRWRSSQLRRKSDEPSAPRA